MFDVYGLWKRSLANYFHPSTGNCFSAFCRCWSSFSAQQLLNFIVLACRKNGIFTGCFKSFCHSAEDYFKHHLPFVGGKRKAISTADKPRNLILKHHNYPNRLFCNLCIFYGESSSIWMPLRCRGRRMAFRKERAIFSTFCRYLSAVWKAFAQSSTPFLNTGRFCLLLCVTQTAER